MVLLDDQMQIESPPILLALGANLDSRRGTRGQTLRAVESDLEEAGIRVLGRSRLYVSPPDPPSADPAVQPDYVNAVLAVDSDLSPAELLHRLHAIEAAHGRTRKAANAPRPLDIDIVDYRGRVQTGAADGGRGLSAPDLPHPRAHLRAFVLRPLQEVAPDWRHPVLGLGVAALIARLPATAAPATPIG